MSPTKKKGLGLKLICRRIIKKLINIKDTPKSIAQGATIGVVVSWTPFVGFHLLLATFFAKITKRNVVAAALGTIVGNPWTFPIIWYATLRMGEVILGIDHIHTEVNFTEFFKQLYHAVIMLDFKLFIKDILPVFIPMAVGCIPFCVIIWNILPRLIVNLLKRQKNNGEENDTGNRM